MNRLQQISLIVFSLLFIFSVILSYLTKSQFIKTPIKPWQLQPSIDADSLTNDYLNLYELLDKNPLQTRFADSSRVTVNILVDAWGVPFEPSLLHEDFALFDGQRHKVYLHHRLANRTRHAEFAEFRFVVDRTAPRSGMYLFGGDSLEYGRNLYVDSLGYGEHMFCQKCTDSTIANILDSVLTAGAEDSSGIVKHVAWTTQDSRDGDRAKLRATLSLVANVARKHPEVRFIVQGTHRPILGNPKIRRESFTHWVPAIVIN